MFAGASGWPGWAGWCWPGGAGLDGRARPVQDGRQGKAGLEGLGDVRVNIHKNVCMNRVEYSFGAVCLGKKWNFSLDFPWSKEVHSFPLEVPDFFQRKNLAK